MISSTPKIIMINLYKIIRRTKLKQEWDKFNSCQKCKNICHFRCCDQSLEKNESISPENSILLFPGEYESVSEKINKNHIEIRANFFGGFLGFCNPNVLNQKACSLNNNFKPLDCSSYPFFPTIVNGNLELTADIKRCPICLDELVNHYFKIKKLWENLSKDKKIREWIKNIKLNGYELVNYDDINKKIFLTNNMNFSKGE